MAASRKGNAPAATRAGARTPDESGAAGAKKPGKSGAAGAKRTKAAPAKKAAGPAGATAHAKEKAAPVARSRKPAATGTTARSRKPARDLLAVYRNKRDFGRTPEPQGTAGSKWKKDNNPFFVIQKHDASRLHYDFRLEVDGVLKSWAIPKGPSMNPADKRLAVETEDHPMDYADFEGIIPEGEYGGGTVIVWDAGPYRNLKQHAGSEVPVRDAYERGTIEVWLEGRKIRGGFALVHSRMGDNAKNWLLIKMRDSAADAEADPVARQPRSVISGRTIEEIAADPKKVWSSSNVA